MSAEPLPPICILAGGRGTRLGSRVQNIPKPLLDVAGEPFVFHQLRLLGSQGAREVVICIGYQGHQVVEQVGGERFGIRITYSDDGPVALGTLGAVRRAAPHLGSRFLVLYGDTYLRIDYAAAAAAWARSGLPAMMSVLRNEGRWDASNACLEDELVTAYDKSSPHGAMHWIDYGLGGLEARALDTVGREVTDLADLYRELAQRRALFGFVAKERFYEIGTPETLIETSTFFASTRFRKPDDPA